MSVVDLLQVVQVRDEAGIIRIDADSGSAILWFESGKLLDAHSGAVTGADAVYRALRFERGRFQVDYQAHDVADAIAEPLHSLLMEGARRIDECHLLLDQLPPADLTLAVDPAKAAAPYLVDEEQAELLELFRSHAGRSIDELLAGSPLGELETLQLVASLLESGVLRPLMGPIGSGSQEEPTLEIDRKRIGLVDDDETTAELNLEEIRKPPSKPGKVVLPAPSVPAVPRSRLGSSPEAGPRGRVSTPPAPVPANGAAPPIPTAPRLPSPSAPRAAHAGRASGGVRPSAPPRSRSSSPPRPSGPPSHPTGVTPRAVIIESEPPRASRGHPFLVGLTSAVVVATLGGVGLVLGGYAPSGALPGLESSDALEHRAETAASAGPRAPAPTCPEGMILVESGQFFMGSDARGPLLESAFPAHHRRVSAFCIDRTEVTVAAYERCVARGECEPPYTDAMWPRERQAASVHKRSMELHSEQCNAGKPGRRSHPVNCISFEQAQSFCRFRNARLPTEAEWELAARGRDGRVYPWGDEAPAAERLNGCGVECKKWHDRVDLERELDGVLYRSDDGYEATAPVGSFPKGATIAGALDMIGNVAEWTADGYAPYPRVRGEPAPSGDDQLRAVRGGDFTSTRPEHVDASRRVAMPTAVHAHTIGFRCASDLESPEPE